VLASDNHNSVGGIGAFARRAQAPVVWLPLEADLTLRDPDEALGRVGAGGGLVAFPAQSNFSGVLHSLSFVRQARGRGYSVLLDAAAVAGSHPLDLARCPADFVALSFYKLFGYPTGLGALVARREALERLTRPWFAGGTVDYVSVQTGRHQLRSGPEAFEDGTPDFLAVGALDSGFAMLEQVGMSAIEAHVARLAARLMGALLDLRHDNRQPVIRLYGPRDLRHRGGVVTFNVNDPDGVPVPYSTVEARARIAGVAVRGGCFCNPGASEAAFGFDAGRVGACLDTLGREFEPGRLADCLGRGTAVGAIRASLGLANNVRDVDRAIELIASFRSRGPAAHVRMSSAAPGA
jgi:selenocysteine lyase/cysteine desulfurase